MYSSTGCQCCSALRIRQIHAQYGLIRLYWNAVARAHAEAWANDKSTLLKGIGIWVFSYLGADIIDRCLVRGIAAGELDQEIDMYLEQTQHVYDWGEHDTISGTTGQRGAREAAREMKKQLSDDDIHMSRLVAAMRNMV